MNETKKLSKKENWREIWEKHPLPQLIKEKKHPYYVDILDEFFHKYLPCNENFEFIELGCDPGRWLHYFNQEFGYKVNGIDYSSAELKLTKKNLEILGVKANLYFGDVLNYKFDRKFDMVFSLGLIEHFEPPTNIIKVHLELTKPGGFTIIGIPNLKYSIYYFLQKIVNKKALRDHVLIDKNDLLRFFKDKKNSIITIQYLGVFNLYLLNLSSKSFLYKIIYYLEIMIEKILKLLKIKKETHFFSPYLFLILRKK